MANPQPSRRRRWLRVSLRALMVLVLLVGGGVGWVAHLIRTQRQAIAAVRKMGTVLFDYQGQWIPDNSGGLTSRTEPAAPRWLRRWLGDELFQTVEAVDLFDATSPAVLVHVAHFDRLKELKVNDNSAGDLGYGALRGLHRLETLEVVGPGVTDAALGVIGGLQSLRTLGIWSTEATDAGFAGLAALNQLDSLMLVGNSQLTDAGVDRLAALTWLRKLEIIGHSQLTDAGCGRLLTGLPALRDLDLTYNAAGPAAATLAALARHHPDLERLKIGPRQDLTVADCAAIGRLTQLRSLALGYVGVTDAGLAHLGRLQRLTDLDLTGTRVSATGLVHLGKLAALESLNLAKTPLGPAADLAALPQIAGLTTLDLTETGITDASVVALARSRQIVYLHLRGNPAITDATLRTLGAAQSLQFLDLVATGVTSDGVRALLTALPRLQVID